MSNHTSACSFDRNPFVLLQSYTRGVVVLRHVASPSLDNFTRDIINYSVYPAFLSYRWRNMVYTLSTPRHFSRVVLCAKSKPQLSFCVMNVARHCNDHFKRFSGTLGQRLSEWRRGSVVGLVNGPQICKRKLRLADTNCLNRVFLSFCLCIRPRSRYY